MDKQCKNTRVTVRTSDPIRQNKTADSSVLRSCVRLVVEAPQKTIPRDGAAVTTLSVRIEDAAAAVFTRTDWVRMWRGLPLRFPSITALRIHYADDCSVHDVVYPKNK